jgi:hypothetical protein
VITPVITGEGAAQHTVICGCDLVLLPRGQVYKQMRPYGYSLNVSANHVGCMLRP